MSFKGMKNVYMCDTCGHGFISQDIDDGTTPFMTKCLTPGCKGNATSFFYKAPQDWLRGRAVVEWYRPTQEETEKLPPHARAHVEKGGLISRYIGLDFSH